jgi:hypothetical protein
LVHFGAREYDPSIGRWITKDPIGFGGGDSNVYVYVGGDPANLTDPLGLWGIHFGGGWSFIFGGGLTQTKGGMRDMSNKGDNKYSSVGAGGGALSSVGVGGQIGVYLHSPKEWAESDTWHAGFVVVNFEVSVRKGHFEGLAVGTGFGADLGVGVVQSKTKLTPAPMPEENR